MAKHIQVLKRSLTYLYRRTDTVCVVSSPRSGSTWVAETLVRAGRFDWVDEPCALPRSGGTLRLAGLAPRTCLLDADTNRVESVTRAMDKMLKGRVGRLQVQPTIRRRLLLKFLRINRMLAWTVETFGLKRNILLVRHPCAVIASKLVMQDENLVWRNVKAPAPDVPNYLRDQVDKLSNGETLRALAINWALDHRIPLYDHPPRDTLLVFYEDLVFNRAGEWQRMLDFCGATGPILADRRSSTASRDFDPGSAITKWKSKLSPGAIEDILTTCHALGVDIYGEDPEPVRRPW